MAVETPSAFMQASTYPAEQTRRAITTLLQRGASIGSVVGGVVGATDMQVTAGTGLQVLVAPGEAWVPGSSVSTQSGYYCRVTSSTALAIAASSETNPRIDTVIAKNVDEAYAGSGNAFSVAVVTGTAESGATLANKKGAGSVPASSMVLAYVLVPAKAVAIEAADIENVMRPVGLLNTQSQKSIIATEQSRENTAYGTLATPDEVTVALPENGLLIVNYSAMWSQSVASAARAAIFIGTNQLKAYGGAGPPNAESARMTAGTAAFFLLSSHPIGLVSGTYSGYAGDATTGQSGGLAKVCYYEVGAEAYETGPATKVESAAGGACEIRGLPAGTYKVGVQFKASSGTVTAKNRALTARVVA